MQKFYHNKKAMAMTTIIVMVTMAILSFVIVLDLYGSVTKNVDDAFPYLKECKITLGVEKAVDDINYIARMVNDVCYTVYLDDLREMRRPEEKTKFVANRMAQSFWVTWEGTQGLFDSDGAFQNAGFDCIILFDLDYSQPDRDQTISKIDIRNFLMSENYGETGKTYNSYLQGKNYNSKWVVYDDLVPGENYGVAIMNPHGGSLLIGDNEDPSLNTVIIFATTENLLNNKCELRRGTTE